MSSPTWCRHWAEAQVSGPRFAGKVVLVTGGSSGLGLSARDVGTMAARVGADVGDRVDGGRVGF